MRRFATTCALVLAAASTACMDESPTGMPAAAPAPAFSLSSGAVTELGWLEGGTSSTAFAVNSLGHAAGEGTVDHSSTHAALFRNGQAIGLGTLGGSTASARGINDADVVVGYSYTTGNSALHAFVWEDGVMTDLNFGAGDHSAAWGINNSGTIVGQTDYEARGYPIAARWEVGGGSTLLGALCTDCASIAKAISDNGHIVGWSGTESGVGRAFILHGGVMAPLPPLPGYAESEALGVNNLGHVVGYSYGYPAPRRATLWKNGQVVDLGEPFAAHMNSEARGINDAGQIVGSVFANFDGNGSAVIWQNGTYGYLPFHIASHAYAINQGSMTAGQRYHNATGNRGAVLWNVTPAIPAAPTEVMLYPTSHNQIEIYWTDGSYDETRFTVQRRTMTSGTWGAWEVIVSPPANVGGYHDSGRTPGTTYQYRVRSCNGQGCSAYTTSAPATTLNPPTEPPYAPIGAQTFVVSASSLRIEWTDMSASEDDFQVQRRVWNGDVWSAWVAVASAPSNASSLVDTGLSGSTKYRYRVRACNVAGCSAYSTAEPIETLPVVPAAPANLMVVPVASNHIAASWTDASSDEGSFVLQRRTKSGATWGPWATVAALAPNTTGHSDMTVTARTVYQYRVRACAPGGCSAFVTGGSVKTP